MTNTKARYTLTTITTTDQNLKERYKALKFKHDIKHEDIYLRGIESYEKEFNIV